jgi:hypothetical protein
MAARAKKRNILPGLHWSNYWLNINQTLQERAVSSLVVHTHHQQVSLRCEKMVVIAINEKNIVRLSQVITGGISMKLQMSDHA